MGDLLRLNSVEVDVTNLGPGPAIGLWPQGCPHACPGCMSVATWDPRAGVLADVDDMAAWMNTTPFRFLTVAGGEAAAQAPAVAALIRAARRDRDWVVTCYTGYRRETLARDQPAGAAALLRELDVLIDGRYVAALHQPLLWRGSANQRIHLLSDRVTLPADESAGIAVRFQPDGGFRVVGVPSTPGFCADLEARLADLGHPVSPVGPSPSTFPFATKEE